MSAIEVKVPDIGDFKDVPVIEVFVKPGDVVKAEDSLVTLESDKATMDVPSPGAGTIRQVRVKVGDKVSEGATLLLLEDGGAGEAATTQRAAAVEAPSPSPSPSPQPQPSPASGRGSGEAASSGPIEVNVPDIGDFKDVPVIEVFVKPGDTVKAEDPLVTLESDKATMDVPSPAAGTVKDVRVKVGDKRRTAGCASGCGGRSAAGTALTPTLARERESEPRSGG